MPGKEGEPPSPQQLKDLRESALAKIREQGEDNFVAEDIQRLSKSDHYVTRFWLHVFDLPGDQGDEAANMIIETFKWRKEFGTNGINVNTVNSALFEKGNVYSHNRDKDGKKLLVFSVGTHEKGKDNMNELKRFFVYYLERLEREENGDLITIMFDCRNAGLKNMDMEFIQFIIGVFKDYYPDMLNYILVFEMPWVLNAAWKVIKAWLPAAAVKKIKFLNKSNISEYVDDDNKRECWGGNDPWEYTFEPEIVKVQPPPPAVNGHADSADDPELRGQGGGGGGSSESRKTVTFAEVKSSTSMDSLSSSIASVSPSGPEILKLIPNHEVIFEAAANGDLISRVQLTNISDKKVAFKIKTTSPEKYRVRPSSGLLSPGAETSVSLYVPTAANNGGSGNSPVAGKDKFLITAVYVEEMEVTNSSLQELLKTKKPDGHYRLRCQLAGQQQTPPQSPPHPAAGGWVTPGGGNLAQPGALPAQDPAKQITILLKKVNELTAKTEHLESTLAMQFYIVAALLGFIFLILIMVWFYIPAALQCEEVSEGARSTTDEL
eukprot:TRINITY_DN9268_c0_g1_i2.p1 TRINITY_DN9268_c0_g1~~TRINITY_DN9268_c0_g1_i2.p1  ORF type:complete len:548 (+),score=161.37 TRINITY_DN9268_c0_g1_i2:124-1767(+)